MPRLDLAMFAAMHVTRGISTSPSGYSIERTAGLGSDCVSEDVSVASYLEDGKAFRLSGKFDEADISFLHGIRACSYQQLSLLIEYAWVAHYRRDWSEALERWAAVSKEFPLHPSGSVGVGRVLLALNRLEEAEEHVSVAMKEFPNDRHLAAVFASIGSAREDWSEALRRWNDAYALDPHSEVVAKGRGVAIWQARMEAGDDDAPQSVAIERMQDPEFSLSFARLREPGREL